VAATTEVSIDLSGMLSTVGEPGACVRDCVGGERGWRGALLQDRCPAASINEWRSECFRLGLLDKDKPESALFSKHKLGLIAANWIACNETVAWTLPN